MFHIIKQEGLDKKIVARLTAIFEYDEEILGRIFEELKTFTTHKKIGNKKVPINDIRNTLIERLYYPYFISEHENPEFELYRFKADI